MLLQSNDRNDLSTTADDTCTYYEYTKNDALGITEMPKRELTVAKACDLTYTKDDVIGDNRTFYDDATSVDTAPRRAT